MEPVQQTPAVSSKASDDDLVMSLVEMAMARPASERQPFIESVCEDDAALLASVRKYVEWEERMQGFMRSPLIPSPLQSESDERPFEPGNLVLSRFRIIREVARGGMGIVYEALDEKLDRHVAIKCPKVKYRRRLPPEVRIASDLTHTNICKTYDIHEANGVEFLSMEYLDGETLSARLKRKPLSEQETRDVARQLAAGVAAAHRAGIVHGDLKSNNVILTRNADGALRAVVTDFGLARNSVGVPDTHDDAHGGTPAYMAPELWKGAKSSPASDVYALGIIIYEIVSGGRRPFESRGAQGFAHSTRTMAEVSYPGLDWHERLHRKPAKLNTKWDSILGRCLQPDPRRRYPSATALEAVLSPSKTRLRVMIACGAAMLALLTGIGTYKLATAPKESVVLAVLPFESQDDLSVSASALYQEVANQVTALRGNRVRSFSALPPHSQKDATHTFTASLGHAGSKVELHARLVNAQTGTLKTEWVAEYEPGELRYAPVALAGVLTDYLDLPPLPGRSVNAMARADYESGRQDLRLLSGVDAAIPKLERAVAADPDSALTQAALAEGYWYKFFVTKKPEWLERSKATALKAQLRDPDTPAVHRIAGVLKGKEGFYEQAAREFRRALEINPNDADAHRMLGDTYDSSNQQEEAIAEAQKAIQLDSGNYRNYQELGALLYSRSLYAEAEVQYRRAVQLAPREPALRYGLATMLELQGRFPEAETELRESLKSAEAANVLEALGYDLVYQRRDSEAIPYFLRATELRPDRARLWIKFGTAYRRAGRSADAKAANLKGRKLAEDEVARNPRYGYARAWLAYVQAWLGDTRSAEANVDQAIQLSPGDQEALIMAASAHASMNHRDQALSILSRVSKDALANFNRFPDFAELKQEPRYKQLLVEKHVR